MFTLTHCVVLKIKNEDRTHLVVFKRIANYVIGVHFHHIRIPVNLSKFIKAPVKGTKTIKTYIQLQGQPERQH
jgi:hypothetical protein